MRGWIKALAVGGMVLGMMAEASAKKCEYSVGEGDVKLEWTAYKTTKKLPVKGTFNTMSLKGKRKAGSLKALATGLSLEIDGASIESGNPGRNVTVSQFFFAKFAPAAAIQASVAKWSGDEKQGTVDIAISLNSVSRTVPFSYTIKDGHFEATATMDMMDFALTTAFDSLHQACGTLHTGDDKVAKTWKDVGLALSADFKKVCK